MQATCTRSWRTYFFKSSPSFFLCRFILPERSTIHMGEVITLRKRGRSFGQNIYRLLDPDFQVEFGQPNSLTQSRDPNSNAFLSPKISGYSHKLSKNFKNWEAESLQPSVSVGGRVFLKIPFDTRGRRRQVGLEC